MGAGLAWALLYYTLVEMCWERGSFGSALSHRKPPRDAYVFEVSEGHELNDVSKDWLSLGRPQDPIVTIQHLHVAEVGIAHAHDDD